MQEEKKVEKLPAIFTTIPEEEPEQSTALEPKRIEKLPSIFEAPRIQELTREHLTQQLLDHRNFELKAHVSNSLAMTVIDAFNLWMAESDLKPQLLTRYELFDKDTETSIGLLGSYTASWLRLNSYADKGRMTDKFVESLKNLETSEEKTTRQLRQRMLGGGME
jgi:hypothetical protein